MKTYSNDPRMTAYILNELSDEERKQFEKELKSNAEMQTELEEIRKTMFALKEELHAEPMPQLSSMQKEEIKAGKKQKKRSWFTIPALRWGVPLAAAATVLVIFSIFYSSDNMQKSEVANIKGQPLVVAKADEEAVEYDVKFEAKDFAAAEQMRMAAPSIAGGTMAYNSLAMAPAAPSGYMGSGSPSFQMNRPDFNTERYDLINENEFILTSQDPRSTFSIDVDTASYSNMRRFLNEGRLPPKDAVRIEEMINYFSYDYLSPTGDVPFSVNIETAASPWHKDYRLVRIGIKGKDIDWSKRPDSNIVFLLDVSGSMEDPNKLPLLKRSVKLLVDKMTKKDKVAIVVYAGASGMILPSTSGAEKEKILAALDKLTAGGATAGGEGIELAYKIASQNFIKGGLNRVILATDGDFNVGVTDEGSLTRLIEQKAKSGVFLTVLGFGMGNLNDSTMEKLADKGNGNYAYIDTFQEANKVMNEQLSGTLLTIAKDVKIQIEFNPATVQAHRLIGYENRKLEHQDFNDDKKDAGDIGAGHVVTVLYEIVPVGVKVDIPGVDPLKYQKTAPVADTNNKELLTLKIRYKAPDGDTSKLQEFSVTDSGVKFEDASKDLQFAASVASFGMLLRDSKHKGGITFEDVIKMAEAGKGTDAKGYRGEFIRLVGIAKDLK